MATRSAVKTVHHIVDGPVSMYLVDANSAIARFPKEWREKPWTDREREAHLARIEREARKAASEAEPDDDEHEGKERDREADDD